MKKTFWGKILVNILKSNAIGYKNNSVNHQLFQQDQATARLAVMFPGKGYTVEGPLFHYSTGVFLNKGYDVLHVNYDYTTEESNSMELDEHIKQISIDVNAVMDGIVSTSKYDHYTLIGKSIGTIALSSILLRNEFADARIIWLTPLLHLDVVFDKMLSSTQPGLCIIGEEDPCYVRERFKQFETKDHLTSILITGTEHSLNYADRPIESIDVLKRVITEINNF